MNFENTPNLILALNCFNNHWIVVTNIEIDKPDNLNCKAKITVYDSLNDLSYLKALKPIFNMMYPVSDPNKSDLKRYKIINSVEINYKQIGPNDCGLFALGYIESLSKNINPFNVKYDQDRMRKEYNNFVKKKIFDSNNFEIKKESREVTPKIKNIFISYTGVV